MVIRFTSYSRLWWRPSVAFYQEKYRLSVLKFPSSSWFFAHQLSFVHLSRPIKCYLALTITNARKWDLNLLGSHWLGVVKLFNFTPHNVPICFRPVYFLPIPKLSDLSIWQQLKSLIQSKKKILQFRDLHKS